MKAIIKINFNTQISYATRIDNDKLIQTSNTYSSGVIEFESKELAELQASKLTLKNGKKVLGVSIVEIQ